MTADDPEGLCSSCLLAFGISGFSDEALPPSAAESTASRPTLCEIGDYELLGEIARGGMGIVYRARQKSLNRLVAVKLILVGQWASQSQLQRFKAEAAVSARLDHPNIVPIYEIGESNGQHFFSMKLIEGENLGQRISDGGRLSARESAGMVARIARAVHYAHQRGILHRDLKPTNILLDAQGEPHLTDFGLAKMFETETSASVSAALLGTPAYMAPEQGGGKGAQITTAADIYSLGVVLYELLTGGCPFTGCSPMEVLDAARQREPESPCRRNPSVPHDLDSICLKCLRKEPARRYGSAEALADDLERWLTGKPIHARHVFPLERAWLWARRKPVVAGLSAALSVVVVATAVLASFMAWRIAAARDRATALADTNRRQLAELNLANGLRLIDDGNRFESLPWLVEALHLDDARHEQNHRIRLASLLRELPRPRQILFHDHPVADAAFSPDESLVATAAGDRIHVRDTGSGKAAFPPLEQPVLSQDTQERLQGTSVSQLAFSPDGRLLLGVCGVHAQLWSAQTGERIGKPMTHAFRINRALFIADGGEVLTASEDGTVRRWSAESGKEIGSPLRLGSAVYSLAVNPNRNLLATASIHEGTRLWSLANWERVGEPLRHNWAALHVAFSPDGKRVATAGADNRARLWDAASGNPVGRAFWHKDRVIQVMFSPDGQRLATVGRDHTAKVWLLADDTSEPLVLEHSGPVNKAAFSPDGSRLVTASADNTARVWDAEDGRPITPPLPHNNNVVNVTFSADGKRLLTASADGTARVWDLPATTRTHALFRDSWLFASTPNLSPNGRYALVMDPEDMAFVWDTAAERIVSPALRHPKPAFLGAVSDDGQIAITACHDEHVRLWDVSMGKQLGDPIPSLVRYVLLLSPDSRRLVLSDQYCILRVWDLNQRTMIAQFPAMELSPRCGIFAPDTTRFAIGASDHTSRVYDVGSKREIAQVSHSATVTATAFNPAGDQVASGGENGQVLVWRVADQKAVATLSHPRRINGLAFSPDGLRLLSAAEDGAARLWDIASGTLLLPPLQHSSPLRAVVFSPDGRRAITVDQRLNPQLWELDTGHALTPPRIYHTRMDAKEKISLAGTNNAWNWNLPVDDRPFDELLLEASVLSGRKLDRLGGLTTLDSNELKTAWERWLELTK